MNAAVKQIIDALDAQTGENFEEAATILIKTAEEAGNVYHLTAHLLMAADYVAKQRGLAIVLGEMFALIDTSEGPTEAEVTHGELIGVEDRLLILNAEIRLAYRVTMHFIKESRAAGTFPEAPTMPRTM